MSENPIEAIEEIIEKINSACDRKHGWIKDGEVAHWLVDNIVTRLITVRGQLGDKAMVNHDNAVDVLEKVHDWLGVVIRDGKCDDHCEVCIGASDLADDVWEVLHPEVQPPKPEEVKERDAGQDIMERMREWCEQQNQSPEKTNPKAKLEDFTDIVCEQLCVHPEQVVPEASFIDDLGADSLSAVEIVMACEEWYGIMMPTEEIEHIKTVGQALDYLKSKGIK